MIGRGVGFFFLLSYLMQSYLWFFSFYFFYFWKLFQKQFRIIQGRKLQKLQVKGQNLLLRKKQKRIVIVMLIQRCSRFLYEFGRILVKLMWCFSFLGMIWFLWRCQILRKSLRVFLMKRRRNRSNKEMMWKSFFWSLRRKMWEMILKLLLKYWMRRLLNIRSFQIKLKLKSFQQLEYLRD